MSDRKDSIREFIIAKNTECMSVLHALAEADWNKPVYSVEGAHWAARDVLAHLADAERGQLGQMQRLVAGRQTIPADFDLDRWNKHVVEKRGGLAPAELMADLQGAFAQTVDFLNQVAETDLDKVGRHPRGDEISVETFFRRMALHRAQHAAEIKAALRR